MSELEQVSAAYSAELTVGDAVAPVGGLSSRVADAPQGGVTTQPERTLLADRARNVLARGPMDVVTLVRELCNLPAVPVVVANQMVAAMLAGRREFSRDEDGLWRLTDEAAPARPSVLVEDAVTFDQWRARRAGEPPLTGLSYVVVDVETTGGRAGGSDRITEIAAVSVRDGEVQEVFETLVNPERSIPAFITALTNISWDMVKDKPTFRQVCADVLSAIEGRVFVAHNATFDWRFVSAEVARATGRRLEGRRLCTVRLARRLLPHLPRRSLDHVARYYGVEIGARHRAAGDAVATAGVLLRLLRDAADRGCTTWTDLDVLLGARAASPPRRRRGLSGLPRPVDRDTTA